MVKHHAHAALLDLRIDLLRHGSHPSNSERCGKEPGALQAVVFLTAGQGYYPFGLLAIAYAAGCVLTERWLTQPARYSLVWSAAAVSAVLGALVALPLLPLRIRILTKLALRERVQAVVLAHDLGIAGRRPG